MRLKSWRAALDIVTVVAVLSTCGTLIWANLAKRPAASEPEPEAPLPTEPVSLVGASVTGAATAPVAILEYTDFECPYCASVALRVLPAVVDKYVKTGRVLMAVRQFPLVDIHKNAMAASLAAVCSGRQGKYWEAHDAFFGDRSALAPPDLRKTVEQLKVDLRQYDACISGDGRAQVTADVQSGQKIGIDGTPTFLFGTVSDSMMKVTHRLSGGANTTAFEEVLEALLKSSAPAR